jgi:hypothetical protein
MRARPSDVRDWQRHGLDDWTVEDVYETYREMKNTPTTIMMAERIAKAVYASQSGVRRRGVQVAPTW